MTRTAPLLLIALLSASLLAADNKPPRVAFKPDDDKSTLTVLVDGKEAFVYQHGRKEDVPHYWPLRSPSGKNMLVQHPNPYPHHRSFWFGDTVRLAGQTRTISTYNALYSKKTLKLPDAEEFPDRVLHVKTEPLAAGANSARLRKTLVWQMHPKHTPVMDETRDLRIVALDGGEYFLDITFTVTAAYGDVQFLSDWVHYAWPYIRINKTFNVANGKGTITNSAGGVNEKGTNARPADWVDYSCNVGGVTEGLAVFSHSDNPRPHKWLTRDYGTFGPRRIDAQSGNKKFVLKKGQSLKTRVGILVHRGDVLTGKVLPRYKDYVAGKL